MNVPTLEHDKSLDVHSRECIISNISLKYDSQIRFEMTLSLPRCDQNDIIDTLARICHTDPQQFQVDLIDPILQKLATSLSGILDHLDSPIPEQWLTEDGDLNDFTDSRAKRVYGAQGALYVSELSEAIDSLEVIRHPKPITTSAGLKVVHYLKMAIGAWLRSGNGPGSPLRDALRFLQDHFEIPFPVQRYLINSLLDGYSSLLDQDQGSQCTDYISWYLEEIVTSIGLFGMREAVRDIQEYATSRYKFVELRNAIEALRRVMAQAEEEQDSPFTLNCIHSWSEIMETTWQSDKQREGNRQGEF